MKKEEILIKAQDEQVDEMRSFMYYRSMWWGFSIMSLTLFLLAIFYTINKRPPLDLAGVYAAGTSANCFYMYKKVKNKAQLIMGIITAAMSILSFVLFLLNYYGVAA